MAEHERDPLRAGIHRRQALKLAALGGGSLLLGSTLRARADDRGADCAKKPLFVGGLTTSLDRELRYEATVRGRLPAGLRGTLYKNGPGIFEREGVRRQTLLDGDGMISAYRFGDRRVEFQNRFVRTPKYEAEQAAGRFLLDTWTTPVDDTVIAAGSDQAGVTVWPWGERLYAFDEGTPGWRLTPGDLSTQGQALFGLDPVDAALFAHGKQLAGSDQFTLFGVNYRDLQYNYLVLDRAEQLVEQRKWAVTDFGPPSYMHDWFVTPHYFVLHAMPTLLDGEAIAAGSVLRDSFRWQAQMPSRLLVFKRGESTPPQIFELDAAWMWHTANAFERSDKELVLDWIGYDDPYHFVGAGAEWETVMQDELRPSGAPGVLRRTVLNLQTGTQHSQRFEDLDDQEFPYIAPSKVGQPYRYTYLVHEPGTSAVLYQAVAKVDLETGRSTSFDFGPGRIPLEPVFVPNPEGRAEDDGWLLVEVANADTGRATLCVLDARCIQDGPIASVILNHHIPMRFHGRWAPAS